MNMSKLAKKEVLHVAKLARLTLSPEEEEKYAKQLSQVVEYVGELAEVNTEGVEPTSQTTGLTDVFRTDELKGQDNLSKENALSGSDKIHNGYFVVDAVLSEKGEK
ncbi:MAG TPA: Asp-tRNA(Asn)/Glu-tRNA(Gln) amidotransferase subunit GatC [Patescibacteria group bacterium]|nr:Asp-tRNA(Asn)/Glu-tRNA(Gln) amidotransferase subunit GatC [Patescibacteria group bacterium]